MVRSKADTVRRYKEAVEAIGGYDAYSGCGELKEKGFLAVAACMEGLKKKLGTALMVSKYEAAA